MRADELNASADVEDELDAFSEFTKKPLDTPAKEQWQKFKDNEGIPLTYEEGAKIVRQYIRFYKTSESSKANTEHQIEADRERSRPPTTDPAGEGLSSTSLPQGIGNIDQAFLSLEMVSEWLSAEQPNLRVMGISQQPTLALSSLHLAPQTASHGFTYVAPTPTTQKPQQRLASGIGITQATDDDQRRELKLQSKSTHFKSSEFAQSEEPSSELDILRDPAEVNWEDWINDDFAAV
jgi:hypothetical protein